MYKIFLFLFLFWGALEAKTNVLVSIGPQKYLVERIGGQEVTTYVIVPPGANSHTYEPTARQILSLQNGEVWFRIGESFENRLLPSLKHASIIDQRDGLDLIKAGCGCCTQEAHDPHIWLSPRLLKQQATQITLALSQKDPAHADLFSQNLSLLHADLEELDTQCASLFKSSTQRLILVSHPAFGYICRDYHLTQLSIEMEGREPTPRYLTELITKARLHGVKTLFLQRQHNPKGGMRVATELGATTHYIDPYVENVIENILTIATLFSHV